MQIIVEFTIKATKHDKRITHENARESTTWLGNRMTNFDFLPTHRLDVEAMDVIDILIITTAQDNEFIIVHY